MVSPFHAGEIEVQTRVGVREQIEAAGQRMIRDAMPLQHREFFAKLPTLLVGSLDAHGRPWASMLAGRPGFIDAPDEHRLHIAVRPERDDPLAEHIAAGAALGLLGIEPHTRRRNRMNGHVLEVDATGFSVGVEQSFGNCPKYIQAREPRWVELPARGGQTERSQHRLSDAAQALVLSADTLFIASAADDGVDVSHRGGKPGFVRVTQDATGRTTLTLPDFRGNFLFNTLGNIVADPRAGLLFADYTSGDLLQLTGSAQIVWEGEEVLSFAGAQRLLKVTLETALWRPAALPLRWSAPELASQLSDTGSWR